MKPLHRIVKKLPEYWVLSIYPILFLIYCYASSIFPGHGSDMDCWRIWATTDVENGFRNVYKNWGNYLPLYHYVLYFYGKIQGSAENIAQHIQQLKYFTLFFEFIAGFFLLKLTQERYKNIRKAVAYSMFYFANLFLFYNSIVWGQIDGILAGLAFISFFFAYKRKIVLSMIFLILAINLKLQAIIFLPVIGLILLPVMIDQFSWKKLVTWVLIPALVQIAIIAPFVWAGDFGKLWKVVTGSIGEAPWVSMNAYNVWDLLLEGDLRKISDEIKCMGISYKNWGLCMFTLTSFCALLPLLKLNYQRFRKLSMAISLEKMLIIGSLIPLLFFYFNTQMHERYGHPAIIFSAAYAIFSKRPLPLILLSVAYFINMENVLQQFHLFTDIPYVRPVCSILYLVTIILLFADLYKRVPRKLSR